MIVWAKTNRLKLASICAVAGDFFMGLTGTVAVLDHEKATNHGDTLLMIGGAVGLIGHATLMLWGKGGRMEIKRAMPGKSVPVFIRGFMPWRYPLDCAFAMFVCSGALYTVAGVYWDVLAMILTGIFVTTGSIVGWLYPQDKTILGFHTVRVTALLYLCGTTLTYLAAWQMQNLLILLAALAYTACNVTLASVRKENQSAYTQGNI